MILTILIVLLGIALAVVYFNREKDEDKARVGILGLTAAIVVLSILRVIGIGGGESSQFDVTIDNSIGEVTADRIAQAATGKRVLIVADLQTTDPFAVARLEAFKERLPVHGLEVIGIEDVRSPTASGEFIPEEGLDARGIAEALRVHPDTDVLVSLVGFPLHNLDQITRQLERIEFFVFEPFSAHEWEDHMTRGTLDGIILQPLDANWSDTSGSGEEVFARRYIFVTRHNLGEMRHRFAFQVDSDY